MASASETTVFAALHCPCTHESEYGVISLHLSEEGAQEAADRHRRKEARKYGGELPAWVKHKVQSMRIKP